MFPFLFHSDMSETHGLQKISTKNSPTLGLLVLRSIVDGSEFGSIVFTMARSWLYTTMVAKRAPLH